jgi:hypothetical protein
VDYKSSLNEYDRFLGSHIYEDIMKDFEDWLDGARDKMENGTDISEVWRCQGRIQVMRDVLVWFENFRGILEEKIK